MTGERVFTVEYAQPVEFFGVNNGNVDLLKQEFPMLKIYVRGNDVKAVGEYSLIDKFARTFDFMQKHYERFGTMNSNDLKQLLAYSEDQNKTLYESEIEDDVLVHGRNGLLIKAKTPNQKVMVESCKENDMIFAIGPAGTGKTYTAVALAVRALKNKEIRRIILTRPAVEAGENLGFLPGDLRDKLDPYLQPLYDALRDMLPQKKLIDYLEDGTIEIAPLAFMRGRTLDNAYVILDEAQNSTSMQLKMFLTRMGKNAKFIITGDITQVDLPGRQISGLKDASRILGNINGIKFVFLDEGDVVRHKLVTKIIRAYENDNIK